MNKLKINNKYLFYTMTILIVALTSSLTVYAATTYLYNSNEVGYTNSTVTGDNVQTAIDEIYNESSNYVTLKTKLNKLEGYFDNYTTGGVSTISYVGDGMNISYDKRLLLYSSPNSIRAATWTHNSSSQETFALSNINLVGNQIKLNGFDISFLPNVGEFSNSTQSAQSVASGTDTDVASLTVTPGTYIIYYGGYFASNSTNRRIMTLSTTSAASGNVTQISRSSSLAVSGVPTFVNGMAFVSISSNTTYHLIASQNSGSSLSTFGRIYTVKLK